MINKLEGIFIPQLDLERRYLIDALDVLTKLQPNEKIRVVDKAQYKIAPDTRYCYSSLIAGFVRWYSGDGWMPTLSVISQVFEKSLSHAYLLYEVVGESQLSHHLNESLELMEKFSSLLPLALEKFQRLGDYYGSPFEKDEEAKNNFAEKGRVYALAIPTILEKIHSRVGNLIPAPPPHCPAMEEMAAMRFKPKSALKDGKQESDRPQAAETSQTPLSERDVKTPFSSKVPKAGYQVSLDALQGIKLRSVKKEDVAKPSQAEALQQRLESARPFPDEGEGAKPHLIRPSLLDKAHYRKPPAKSIVRCIEKNGFEYKEPDAARKAADASVVDSQALLQSIWLKISMNVDRLQDPDQSLDETWADESEWTVIHSSLVGFPVEEVVTGPSLPQPSSFTPSLSNTTEENEELPNRYSLANDLRDHPSFAERKLACTGESE